MTTTPPPARRSPATYLCLILAGTLLGTLLGTATYLILRTNAPRYTASVSFMVKPVSQRIGEPNSVEQFPTKEEIARFIRRQRENVLGDTVLDQALLSDAFQTDYRDRASGRKSRWLSENVKLPKVRLREDIELTPIPDTDVYKISFTTNDNTEAANLVNAVCDVYLDNLRSQEKQAESTRLQDLRKALTNLEETVRTLQKSLADFRVANDISIVMHSNVLEIQALGALNADLTKCEMEAAAAAASRDSIKKQVESDTLVLRPDQQDHVDSDPTLRKLENQKLELQQDMEVAKAQSDSPAKALESLRIRIDVVTRQATDKREELSAQARLRMQDSAETVYSQLQARLQDLRKRRDEKARHVKDLDDLLIKYNEKAEELKTQTDVLSQVKTEFTIEQIKSQSDFSRVQRLGGAAVAPDPSEITSPIWYTCVCGGSLIGLAASLALTILLALNPPRPR